MGRYSKPEPGHPCVIELAGRSLQLIYTLKVLHQLDVERNIKVLKDGLPDLFSDPGELATILYYGLKTHQPDITEDWVAENADASMLLDLSPVLVYATRGQWPDVEKTLKNIEAARERNLIGSPSGPSGDTTSPVVN
jgi:hypothetical protein